MAKRRQRHGSPASLRRKEFRQQTAHLAGRLTDSDLQLLEFIADRAGLPLRVVKAYDAGYDIPQSVERQIQEGMRRLRDAGLVLEVDEADFAAEGHGIFHGVRLNVGRDVEEVSSRKPPRLVGRFLGWVWRGLRR